MMTNEEPEIVKTFGTTDFRDYLYLLTVSKMIRQGIRVREIATDSITSTIHAKPFGGMMLESSLRQRAES
ncbi:MAG: hypothetical protein E3K36_15360 [Candidatus Brocadia sp.]|nr:hypothetical protein [Candidatus Brocadia sp.]